MGRKKQEGAPGKGKPVQWDKNPHWAEKVVEYLINNPTFRAKLFSDSTQDAKEENRPKVTAKEAKKHLYAQVAENVFKEDEDEYWRKEYARNPARFATAVNSQFTKWKKMYHKCITLLGHTGAGIDPATIKEGSRIKNLMDQVEANWPLFPKFHAFWREIPSFNPIGTGNSVPGNDHAKQAKALFSGGDDLEGENGMSEGLDGGDSDVEGSTGNFEALASPTADTFDNTKSDPSKAIPWLSSPSQSPPSTPMPKIEKSTKNSTKSPQSSLNRTPSSQSLRDFKIQPSKAKPSKSGDPLGRLTEMQATESQQQMQKRKLAHLEKIREIDEKERTKKLKMELRAKLEGDRLALEKERLEMEKADREATRKEKERAAERAHELEMVKQGVWPQHAPQPVAGGSNLPNTDDNVFPMLPTWRTGDHM